MIVTLQRMLTLALFIVALRRAEAHSYLLRPTGYLTPTWTGFCRIGGPSFGHRGRCPGPCLNPSVFSNNQIRVPPMVYRRGEKATLVWAKNGHKGGFVRFTIVPHDKRMSKATHAQMAFHYTCFTSGEHKCRLRRCGTDKRGMAYRTEVQIPTTYPDGEYLLGYAWYGGTIGNRFGFGDYYTCANIVIRGGPKTNTFQPKFVTDDGRGSCMSGTDRLGVCPSEPCRGKIELKSRVPAEFRNGRQKAPLQASWFE